MKRDEFEERRSDFNDRAQARSDWQKQQNEKYDAKLQSGKVSGFGKFVHGVNSVLTAFIKAGTKTLNNM